VRELFAVDKFKCGETVGHVGIYRKFIIIYLSRYISLPFCGSSMDKKLRLIFCLIITK
jgi:hypothetical protein